MIVKHQGVAMNGEGIVIGYAACIEDKSYIILENGQHVHVRRTSVKPLHGMIPGNEGADEKLRNNGKHSLYYLNLNDRVITNLKQKGVLYIEDMEGWTDCDYGKIRGIGIKKQTIIQKVMQELNLNYSGTNYIDTQNTTL